MDGVAGFKQAYIWFQIVDDVFSTSWSVGDIAKRAKCNLPPSSWFKFFNI